MAIRFIHSLLVIVLICKYGVQSAPLAQQNNKTEEHEPNKQEPPPGKPIDFDLPYGKYLREVMDYLEQDPSFKKYLEKATEDDINSGKMAGQLEFVNHHVRNKLDEVKRQELNRLKTYARRVDELSNGLDRSALSRPLHVDVRNPHSFEIEDLMKLIRKTTEDLEMANRQRRDEFKEYEMNKEWERREKLREMDEEHRKRAEREYEEDLKKRKEHPKLHHPGSKPQLEEVWTKEDKLPAAEFDPDTLFSLHDINGDGHWSEEELLAMFVKEASKEGGDPREREEEMHRMKEHVMNETDTDHNGMISKKEFDAMISRQDFNQDPGWDGIDDQQIFNDQEFEDYQRSHHGQGLYPPPPVYVPQGAHPGGQYQYNAQPNGYPMGSQSPYPPVHGNQIGQMHPSQYQGGPQGGQFQGGFQQPQGNYQGMGQPQQQFQQPQFQQGNQQPQFQQGLPQQQQFQQGVPQQQQFQQGIPQQQQFQPGVVPNQQYVQGQQQFNQGGFQTSTEKSSGNQTPSPTKKAEEPASKVSESQPHQQQNNAVH